MLVRLVRDRVLGRLWFGVIIIVVVILEEGYVVQGGIFGAPQALYGPGDHVVSLNATSIKNIYGTSNAWVVEFYSSWCGHCINFAPVYKQFATEVEGWQTVVKVAGIDCADETNIPACREYEIMGYPTIIFFPPNSPEKKKLKTEEEPDLYRGEQFQRSDKVSDLKRELIELLTPYFPNVLGQPSSSLTSFIGVWKFVKENTKTPADSKVPGPSLVLLLFEKEKSLIGKELALLLSSYPEIRVVRFQQRNKLYERLGFKSEWPAVGYVTKDLHEGKFVIPKNRDIVKYLQFEALKMIKVNVPRNDGGAPAVQIASALQQAAEDEIKKGVAGDDDNKQENNLEEPPGGPVPSEDVVSLEDLIHAVRNSLRNEVGIVKLISGEKLTALKNYVHVLAQLFPADRRDMVVFLMRLDNFLEEQAGTLSVNEYLDKLTELELELHPWDIEVNSWGTCRGTLPGRRGYTCGLWRLFHTLTILASQKSQEILALSAIHGYVKEFFGCSECVSHFTKMVADEHALSLNSAKEQAIWLWRAHNKVNIRLKGSNSEDPGFPKGYYPTKIQCSSCYTEDGSLGVQSFSEDVVLDYLIKIYTKPVRTMQHHEQGAHQKRDASRTDAKFDQSKLRHHSPSRFFSGTDYWIFCIVYLSVAALLIFGYYHFKLGSNRRNRFDPLTLCRKLVQSSSRSMV